MVVQPTHELPGFPGVAEHKLMIFGRKSVPPRSEGVG